MYSPTKSWAGFRNRDFRQDLVRDHHDLTRTAEKFFQIAMLRSPAALAIFAVALKRNQARRGIG